MKWDLRHLDPHRERVDRETVVEEDVVNAMVEYTKALKRLETVWDSRRCSECVNRLRDLQAVSELLIRRHRDIQHEINGKPYGTQRKEFQ